jgi:hypothetical protein
VQQPKTQKIFKNILFWLQQKHQYFQLFTLLNSFIHGFIIYYNTHSVKLLEYIKNLLFYFYYKDESWRQSRAKLLLKKKIPLITVLLSFLSQSSLCGLCNLISKRVSNFSEWYFRCKCCIYIWIVLSLCPYLLFLPDLLHASL